ncbi:MAG: 4-(cytidine 5'-diphospho)-2-C-methyl-D-erythritol kinase [Akkermansiaceae bacterium]|nr:4-(cytidine 5'-diphospho)-2-C-methyl-D-erythritol kinase [Akkermansiaceae bacterium]
MPLTHSAPAKINLSLRVLRKREDGFHEIESLMTLLPDLADEITLSDEGSFPMSCSDPSLDTGEDNLVVKALRAFEKASGIEVKCAIHLEKRIPHGAGLGGGSSDAATTLLALNDWHHDPIDEDSLIRIAAEIGSDVPFFLLQGPAWVRGRGEIIADAEAHATLPLLLLKPAFGVATPDAYRRWQDSEWPAGLDRSAEREIEGIRLVNDLERPVFAKHRFLAELVNWLENQPETRAAQLCGSGSTIFAILADLEAAEALADRARAELEPNLWHWAGTTA